MAENDLVIVEQRHIKFYDDEIIAVRVEDGTVYVPVRPICNLLGIRWGSQYERIQRDPILAEMTRGVLVTRTPEQGGSQEMTCLPLDMMHGWLFGIQANRVNVAVREKLLTYQRECYRVLSDAFLHDQVTHRPEPAIDDLLDTNSPTAQAYKMIMAMAQMARQQLVLESRMGSAEASITQNRSDIIHLDTRLQIVEAGSVSQQVDEAQASRISQAVKAIAIELGKRSRRNEFGGVYGELYRRFDITGYKLLPAAKFDEAINFLSGWYQSLTDADVPF
jgi:hypothetical protein